MTGILILLCSFQLEVAKHLWAFSLLNGVDGDIASVSCIFAQRGSW